MSEKHWLIKPSYFGQQVDLVCFEGNTSQQLGDYYFPEYNRLSEGEGIAEIDRELNNLSLDYNDWINSEYNFDF